ncbi:hypothetical protein [Actinomyces vulturis]|uniref:hypothetical protein n=1 Tax=Actinomyces vulturis TaxID=1857645 RepID=UPI0008378913|nr:hypothetical protein [Actinomyces vulturis]
MELTRRNALFLGLFGAVGVGSLAGVGTQRAYSAWRDTASIPAITLQSGTLDLSEKNVISWREMTCDREPIHDLHVEGGKFTTPIAPGDIVEGKAVFNVELEGTTITGKLTVNSTGGAEQAASTIALASSTGEILAGPSPIGTELNVTGIKPGSTQFTVIVESTYGDFDDSDQVRDTPALSFTVALDQEAK